MDRAAKKDILWQFINAAAPAPTIVYPSILGGKKTKQKEIPFKKVVAITLVPMQLYGDHGHNPRLAKPKPQFGLRRLLARQQYVCPLKLQITQHRNSANMVHLILRGNLPGNQIYLQANVLFALAYASGPPPVQTDFQHTWLGSGQSIPFISYGLIWFTIWSTEQCSVGAPLRHFFHKQPRWLPLLCHTFGYSDWL